MNKPAHLRIVLPALLPLLALGAPLAAANGGADSLDSLHEGGCLHCAEARAAYAAMSAPARGFDPLTGKNLRHYPPARVADFVHMELHLEIADMDDPRLDALEILRLRPLGTPMATLTLNVGPEPHMVITDVEATTGDAPIRLTSTHEGETLRIDFDPPVPVGADTSLAIDYTLVDPPEGLMWTPATPAWPGRPAQIHTQGQAEANHYWFPIHDFPNEKLTTELTVTVPEPFLVSSNGRLVEKSSPADGYARFHWLQDKPHAPYLVTLIVGQFDVVDVGGRTAAGRVPMPVYAPLGKGDQVRQTYGRTAEMVRLFEDTFDEPYPWDRYAQLVVHNFAFGGMENTSATTMFDTAILDRTALLDGDLDGLISHELAHQWFGDLVTCKSWEHLWLNEGFATYLESLWFEHLSGRDAYEFDVYSNMRSVFRSDTGAAPEQPAMVSKVYRHPVETIFRESNPYSKGCSILHMLRERLGTAPDGRDVLFTGLAQYIDDHKGQTVESYDLRRALEHASGQALERFFVQWTERPGIPRLDVRLTPGADTLSVTVTQNQTINADNPAFDIELPLLVILEDGSTRSVTVRGDTRVIDATFETSARPARVVVDPNMTLLAVIDANQPEADLLAQLRAGPTMFAKLRAADALADRDTLSPAACEVLASVVRDRKALEGLRRHAIDALSATRQADTLLALADRMPSDARVRRTLIEALATIADDDELRSTIPASKAALIVREAAAGDESYGVRASAIKGVGRFGSAGDMPMLEQALTTESQHDQIRRAALDAIASLDAPGAFDLAVRYAAPGTNSFTRTNAVRAIASLAHNDPDRALNVLAALINDRELRTSDTATEALATLNDARAVPILEAFIAASESALRTYNAEMALTTLRASLASAAFGSAAAE